MRIAKTFLMLIVLGLAVTSFSAALAGDCALVIDIAGDVKARLEGGNWTPMIGESIEPNTEMQVENGARVRLLYFSQQQEVELTGPGKFLITEQSITGGTSQEVSRLENVPELDLAANHKIVGGAADMNHVRDKELGLAEKLKKQEAARALNAMQEVLGGVNRGIALEEQVPQIDSPSAGGDTDSGKSAASAMPSPRPSAPPAPITKGPAALSMDHFQGGEIADDQVAAVRKFKFGLPAGVFQGDPAEVLTPETITGTGRVEAVEIASSELPWVLVTVGVQLPASAASPLLCRFPVKPEHPVEATFEAEDLPVEAAVAIRLAVQWEGRGHHAQAAGVWLSLLMDQKVASVIAEAHLRRLQNKIAAPVQD